MLHLLLAALVASAPDAAITADSLQCRVTAGASRRCAVTIPDGRRVRPCEPGARCDDTNRYVARVVSSGGARCKISKKRTDWSRTVVASISKKTAKRPGAACQLHVELR